MWRELTAIRHTIMLSLALSSMTFFVSSVFIKRYFDDAGVASGMTRGVLVFSIALMVSYGVAAVVDFATK